MKRSNKRQKPSHRGSPRPGMTVVDLFSGCGGLSLGFDWAGFIVAAAIESDPMAAAVHALNFGHDVGARDIMATHPSRVLAEELGGVRPAVIVGGPPCQAFARIGRAKLREVARKKGHLRAADAEVAHLHDKRADLAERYVEFVRIMQPSAVLLENVPDMANPGGGRSPVLDTCDHLEDLGYKVGFTLLNAAEYGVPQFRERLFILGYRREVIREDLDPGSPDWWPAPICHARIPHGYRGTRAVAHTAVRSDGRFHDRDHESLFGHHRHGGGQRMTQPINCRQALSDLPPIDVDKIPRGMRLLTPGAQDPHYARGGSSKYARLMATLPTPQNRRPVRRTVSAHVTRCLQRDFRTFAHMTEGQDYCGNLMHLGRQGTACTRTHDVPTIAEMHGEESPPYDLTKFPNKWWKLHPAHPSRTLTAHMGKDTYSHIHYEEGRTISVREAARLQSFPDAFLFNCAMNAGYRMVGNAVPPLLAYALARHIRTRLTRLSPGRDLRAPLWPARR